MTALLPRLRPPPGPVSGRWGFAVGDTIAGLVRAPRPVARVIRLLDNFGGLVISDQSVEFDGDAVDWSDVQSIETHSLVGYLLSGALSKQANRLPLPWFPGRRLLLDVASDTALTALVATVGNAAAAVLDVRIPAEVNYRGTLRNRTLTAGVLATVLLADPAVRAALVETARAHGVTVRRADDDALDAAERRVRWLKDR
ncbi:hypothetical protein Mycch_3429 [Mycolicibacterium chubuense NBB4]|uniref:Uncharacterized protein n=1 Tax=Mycolicibacterium chubuense (strain NBB4) TaxID=710421 RepID=I4BLL2_MYCCN|nr:hypothetical protein [Mycolicibacterium chubuense]AFM18169.1 hypothetical protein Mycch_3429 [Mycolicibacterium chubuense NBB4]